jgi:signal transduction histidine kinase
VLDDLGLVAAVEWQAQEFVRRSGTECKVVERLGALPLGRPVSTAAFRILQEGLTNVTRHAAARQVTVTLEESRGELVLTLLDDGKGIKPEAVTHPRSLGLLGMRERAARLGGTVEIGPGAQGGTLLRLRLPLPPAAVRA